MYAPAALVSSKLDNICNKDIADDEYPVFDQ